MGNIRLYGSTSGYTELAPPAVAPDGVLSLPTGTGTLATQASIGLVKIVDQSFTAASTVSVDNCFTSAYDNYYLVLNATHSGNNSTLMRLRATGTDNTSSNYDASGYYGGTGSGNGITNASTNWAIVVGATASNRLITATINDPFKSIPTMMSGTLYETNNSATQYWYGFGMGHRSSASFDGFTLSFGVSTTGTLRVYGYRN